MSVECFLLMEHFSGQVCIGHIRLLIFDLKSCVSVSLRLAFKTYHCPRDIFPDCQIKIKQFAVQI